MEYHNDKWCISVRELEAHDIMTAANYKALSYRNRIKVVRKGRGAGNYALVEVDSLPERFKVKVDAAFSGALQGKLEAWIRGHYRTDHKAAAFYADADAVGFELSPAKRIEYTVNASVLNTCIELYTNAKVAQKLMGKEYDWERMAAAIEILRKYFGHTLPASVLRFRKKVAEYRKNGYPSLISGKFGNGNARLLTTREGQVIQSIAARPNQPWNTDVREKYRQFVLGELDVFNPLTGELMDPEIYARKRNGEPWIPSQSTINNYLNRPDVKAFIEQALMPRMAYYHEKMPHVHRHNGQYSLSQVTMDDVDLSRRMKGNETVHAYYAYDMVSGCVLSAAYSRKKDNALVEDCFMQMFRLIKRRQWGIPAGIEVENHLMSKYADGLLKEGLVFGKVRFCAPQNSQEKSAESLNGAKKRSIIHKNHEAIGRFFGKGKWRTYQEKISDETNRMWLDKKYYSYEELVADDMRDNREWNDRLHPDQSRYPGMTRWEVLVSNVNPCLRPYDEKLLARYLGTAVETSVRRNSTVRVNHRDWWLSKPEVLEKLAPNNYKVTAYYLPDEYGESEDIWIYQNGICIDKVCMVNTFNRIMAEQTQEDRDRFAVQMGKINAHRNYIESHRITPAGIQPRMEIAAPVEEIVVPVLQPSDDAASQDGAWYLDYLPAEDQRARGREAL